MVVGVILLFNGFVYTSVVNADDTNDDLVFIHHSCGKNWLDNSLHAALLAKDYIDERNDIYYNTDVLSDSGRPDSLAPAPGDYTNMNHWILWFNDYLEGVKYHGCADGFNQIIMFKSCYPISNIVGNGTEPGDPFSSTQTIVNYKAVYRHPSGPGNTYTHNDYTYKPLEDVFADNPDVLFIPVTAPPLCYSCTNDENAHRARVFNNWLNNEWLDDYNDDNPGLNNVAVYDWFNFLANPDDHPTHPNRLKAEYGGTTSNSHPNALANQQSTQDFATNPDNFIDTAWNDFLNNPPSAPSNPFPPDGATGVDINADLSWNCSDPDGDDLTYDVYFEANDPTPDILVSNNQSENWYDPGTMDYNTHYYWQIVAWDNYGESTSGSIWDFITGSEPNDPPYLPSDSYPVNGSTDIDIDVDLSWVGDDPDPEDTIVYDVYLEANDPTPDNRVADDISETTFDPGTLEYETTYYWRVIAKDNHGASTPGPVWHFITESVSVSDLNCSGSLQWTEVTPGETVKGSFIVENIGESDSLLDWKVTEWASWGNWIFTPMSGDDLKPSDGLFTVNISVTVPNEKNSEFTGEVKIVNKENISDYNIIPVYLKTPRNKPFIFNFNLLNWLFERFPHAFPILRNLLEL
ncbi:hypothetical protein MBGDF03_00263 [Thermoplasmatales archaeon SCGC AB-540-F20]|nr:hypothetical protein MBGDF03_00263 [Thermoplasmatales archaeon SCGC AB-540-F20]